MKTPGQIRSKYPETHEGVIMAMQEYAELIAFDFQKYRKKKLGFAFSDERLKAEFEEYKKARELTPPPPPLMGNRGEHRRG